LYRRGLGASRKRGDAGYDVLPDQTHGLDGLGTVQHLELRNVVITVCDCEGSDLGQIGKRSGQNFSFSPEPGSKIVQVMREGKLDRKLGQQSLERFLDGFLDVESKGAIRYLRQLEHRFIFSGFDQ